VLIEDYGCLTFLIADAHAKGSLQVKLPATGKWISADPVEGCFVCNIGDMMQVSV
jgi:isopenicillin N synthase-like dioxygenase